MKFGKRLLEAAQRSPFAQAYLDYKRLKVTLRTTQDAHAVHAALMEEMQKASAEGGRGERRPQRTCRLPG